MSSGETSRSSARSRYMEFPSKGDTRCTRCETTIPKGATIEAVPPRTFLLPWSGHRCVPACSQAPQPPAPSTPQPSAAGLMSVNGDRALASPPADEAISHEQVMQVAVKEEDAPASSRAIAATPTRLSLDAKRPHSNLDDGGGSGSGGGSRVTVKPSPSAKKKTRTPAAANSNISSSASAAPRPRPQRTAAATAGGMGAPPVHSARPMTSRRVAAKRADGAGAGRARRGGGVSCNLAVAEGWTPAATTPSSMSVPVKSEASSAAQSTGNNVPAELPAPTTPAAASAAPAPAATPPSANGGGRGGGSGGINSGKVSVSDIFRAREVTFNSDTACKVGKLAKTMFVRECGKPAGKALKKRPTLDGNGERVECNFPPYFYHRENAYPSRYRDMLEEAFDSVVGRAP